jgi:arsenate reductase (glutaredoxin)
MAALIWHNPRCSTSRNALALLRHAGIEPEIVDYLKQPPTRAQLQAMLAAAGIEVRAALRSKEAAFVERGLADPTLDDAALLEAMLADPVLIERPFVCTTLGTRLGRPLEALLEILPPLATPFVKENGQVLES